MDSLINDTTKLADSLVKVAATKQPMVLVIIGIILVVGIIAITIIIKKGK
jgi:hypothetical protein